ncbi:hypothetical protein [Streptomyces sp. NPDC008139]|uniref:hypothetical protein n=1 Tax=Streptomyces sp. NPDC008139 TaxID=3364814 RepID=UPI0036F0341F
MALATVTGTALVPGVSRNRRLYTADVIGKAVQRAQARIDSGAAPLTTLTHHEAGDDSTRIVGAIRRIWQEADGTAKYEADIADTSHGRDILALVSGENPVLKGVSIRGAWIGPIQRVIYNGETVETGALELDGLDYTRKPGVLGAAVERVDLADTLAAESHSGRALIYESAPDGFVQPAQVVELWEMDTEQFRSVAAARYAQRHRGRSPFWGSGR